MNERANYYTHKKNKTVRLTNSNNFTLLLFLSHSYTTTTSQHLFLDIRQETQNQHFLFPSRLSTQLRQSAKFKHPKKNQSITSRVLPFLKESFHPSHIHFKPNCSHSYIFSERKKKRLKNYIENPEESEENVKS